MRIALLLLGSYLLGSIPFGLIIGRMVKGIDIRQHGSGNIGASNVGRSLGAKWFAVTFLFDVAKGLAPVLAARCFLPHLFWLPVAAGLLAIIGHNFSVFLGFKGGKGVAVYIGILIGLFWPAAIVFCVVWLITAVISRYSSLSALVASVVAPIFLLAFGHLTLAALFALLTLLLFYMHRANISRLMAGTEGKIGQK